MPARGPQARRGPPQLLWPSGRASAGGPGLVSSCARVFFVAPSFFRAAATFFVAAPWFPTSGNPEGAAAFRQIHSLSTFAVETLLALRGAELPSWRGVAAKHELEIIAKPLGLLHEALLSGHSFLRTETRSYSLPLQRIACRLPICLVRC